MNINKRRAKCDETNWKALRHRVDSTYEFEFENATTHLTGFDLFIFAFSVNAYCILSFSVFI